MKKEFTKQEWGKLEEVYINTINNTIIPNQATTKEVISLTSRIDKILTRALFDQAAIKNECSSLELKIKNAEASLFYSIKAENLSKGTKLTENEVKGLVKDFLMKNPIQGYSESCYDKICDLTEKQSFMDAAVKTLSEKKSALVAIIAMLKLDASFAGINDNTENDADKPVDVDKI